MKDSCFPLSPFTLFFFLQYKDMWHALLKKKIPTSEIFTELYTYVIIYSIMDLISFFTLDSVLTLIIRRMEEFKFWVHSSPASLTKLVI